MKTYIYIHDIQEKDRLLIKSLFDFEEIEGVLVFDEISKSEVQLIENDFNVKMTVVFQGVDFVLDKIKQIAIGYYTYAEFLLDLYKNGYVHNIILDQELKLTADTFLHYDKSVNQTAESLYLHRNTLNYRLDRIHKLTGLDLKTFKGAFVYYLLTHASL